MIMAFGGVHLPDYMECLLAPRLLKSYDQTSY
jgi:hypothetical protein